MVHQPGMPDDLSNLTARLGLSLPIIYMPRPGVDLYRWPVVACDQFTSEPEYWRETEAIVGRSPSTLNMILPEIYLEHPGPVPVAERISKINQTMREYLRAGILQPLDPGWILTDRATSRHPSRKGLVVAIDLDRYDYQPGNRHMIRATEGTVLDRIPPRLLIRRDAPLELPHVQLLIDDPGQTVIEPLYDLLQGGKPLYETRLMQSGGAIRGWAVPAGGEALLQAAQALSHLDSVARLGLLAVVGDGNHSLATAKTHWETVKRTAGPDHPAHWSLVELVNIHDEGLEFEPIHRVVRGLSAESFLAEAARWFSGRDLVIEENCSSSGTAGNQSLPLVCQNHRWLLQFGGLGHSLLLSSLQPFLDNLEQRKLGRIDYIHGIEVIEKLAGNGDLGLVLPAMDKSFFFQTIAAEGILPRKTFSMGEAREKRYYFESRRIL